MPSTAVALTAYVATPGNLNLPAAWLSFDDFDCEDVWMDKGRCTFRVPLPRPVSLVTDAVIVLELNGVKVPKVLIVDTIEEVTLCDPEEQGVTVTAYFTAHALNRGRIQPSRGYGAVPFSDTRVFTVFSPEFDISGWINASAIVAHQGWASTSYTGQPSGWQYPDSVLIGPQNGNDHAGEIGQWWTQAEFTLATDTNVVFDCAADNWAEVWLDGQMLGTVNGWGNTTTFTAFCKAGTHRIGAKVYNTADYTSNVPPLNSGGVVTEGNPTFFLLAAFPIDYHGQRGGLIIQTDTSWKIRAFLSAAPGWTFGAIALRVLAEMQAQGQLVGWVPTWTAVNDSFGHPWPVYETLSLDVGRGFLDVLQEWAVSKCDWSAFANFTSNEYWLSLYNWSLSPTIDSGVDYEHNADDADASTLEKLTTKTAAVVADNVMVRWAGGFIREPLVGGVKQGFLKMGACHSEGEARVVADYWLQVHGVERKMLVGVIVPNNADPLVGNIPYLHYNCGNGITLDGQLERVVRIQMTLLDGNVAFEVSVKDWLSYVEDRVEWALHRLSDGT